MKRAIVIGKFYPPHLGHKYLIDYAEARSDQLTVLVCDSPAYAIPAEQRKSWLEQIHPHVTVRIIADLGDDDDSKGWAEHTLRFLGYRPDVVFSSESYGPAYARHMKTKHVMVDQERTNVPISATRVRADILKEWDYLHPVVKADLAIRVAVVGAESTGTTTLSKDLAKTLHAPWVPEYGRLYSEGLVYSQHEWNDEEFVHIAKMQQDMEREFAKNSHGIIVCDTNAFATSLWQKRYMGHTTPEVEAIAQQDRVNQYFLTGDEIPFVQDGIRDGEHIRHDMHTAFARQLDSLLTPHETLRGPKRTRVAKAKEVIAKRLQEQVV